MASLLNYHTTHNYTLTEAYDMM